LFLILGFLAGCMIAGSMVYTREMMNTRIDAVEKLEKRDLPILSVIPNLKETSDNKFANKGTFNVSGHPISSDVVTLFDFVSAGTEAFRQLRNNILFSHKEGSIKTITVTSPSKGEGKTTLCANLGVVLAETAKNILILDIDFRRPNAHNKFGLSQEPGVMEVLFEDAKLEDTIQHTIVNGLDLLSVGRKPANPSGVIQNMGMIELIDTLKYKYEYIILDTTPYGLISDAAPILKRADANILVSRFNQTKEAQLDQTIDKLNRIEVNTIGTVLTDFNYKKSSDYDRKNYYRHAYAYEEYRSYVKD
jgi:capsular exopolysaccharide synthesis family protein